MPLLGMLWQLIKRIVELCHSVDDHIEFLF
jgi:hypothetical protein